MKSSPGLKAVATRLCWYRAIAQGGEFDPFQFESICRFDG